MKRYVIALLAVLFVFINESASSALPEQKGSYAIFYKELAPYGRWISDSVYGYAWVPDVGKDFKPYLTNGWWMMTEYGSTWFSAYPWGWATFHYGRWTYSRYYGWTWIPGLDWAPAWVCWRRGYGRYGWAPLHPGFAASEPLAAFTCPTDWWTFIAPAYLHDSNFRHYWHGAQENLHFIRRTAIIGAARNLPEPGDGFMPGPSRDSIRSESAILVSRYHILDAPSPGAMICGAGTVTMFRLPVCAADNGDRPTPVLHTSYPIGAPAAIRTNGTRQPQFRIDFPTRQSRIDSTGRPVSVTGQKHLQ